MAWTGVVQHMWDVLGVGNIVPKEPKKCPWTCGSAVDMANMQFAWCWQITSFLMAVSWYCLDHHQAS